MGATQQPQVMVVREEEGQREEKRTNPRREKLESLCAAGGTRKCGGWFEE